jgi:alpha-aminoadipic semialdehyde synthase
MVSAILKARINNRLGHTFKRFYGTTNQTIGIRREDKSRWERRAPLTPEGVKKLIQETQTKVYVQPSTKRIFTNESYEKVNYNPRVVSGNLKVWFLF